MRGEKNIGVVGPFPLCIKYPRPSLKDICSFKRHCKSIFNNLKQKIKKTQIDTCPSKTSFKLSLCQLPWSAIEQIVDALHVTTMVAGDEYKETAE